VDFLLPAGANPYLNYSGMIFVGNYFTLMAFHLLGYVVYQYHEALGHPVYHPEDEEQAELALFDELMEAGNHQAALTELREVMARNPERRDLKERLVRLARLTGDAETLKREGPEAIADLVRGGRVRDATDLYLDCLQADPAFRPHAPEVYDVIARELRNRGQLREALSLLNGFHQRFPEHPLVPRAYVLAARMFMDDAGKPEQAQKLLAYLQRNFGDSPYAAEVDSLQRSLA
jgi:tetratricopeptide (TPR) repeat protein